MEHLPSSEYDRYEPTSRSFARAGHQGARQSGQETSFGTEYAPGKKEKKQKKLPSLFSALKPSSADTKADKRNKTKEQSKRPAGLDGSGLSSGYPDTAGPYDSTMASALESPTFLGYEREQPDFVGPSGGLNTSHMGGQFASGPQVEDWPLPDGINDHKAYNIPSAPAYGRENDYQAAPFPDIPPPEYSKDNQCEISLAGGRDGLMYTLCVPAISHFIRTIEELTELEVIPGARSCWSQEEADAAKQCGRKDYIKRTIYSVHLVSKKGLQWVGLDSPQGYFAEDVRYSSPSHRTGGKIPSTLKTTTYSPSAWIQKHSPKTDLRNTIKVIVPNTNTERYPGAYRFGLGSRNENFDYEVWKVRLPEGVFAHGSTRSGQLDNIVYFFTILFYFGEKELEPYVPPEPPIGGPPASVSVRNETTSFSIEEPAARVVDVPSNSRPEPLPEPSRRTSGTSNPRPSMDDSLELSIPSGLAQSYLDAQRLFASERLEPEPASRRQGKQSQTSNQRINTRDSPSRQQSRLIHSSESSDTDDRQQEMTARKRGKQRVGAGSASHSRVRPLQPHFSSRSHLHNQSRKPSSLSSDGENDEDSGESGDDNEDQAWSADDDPHFRGQQLRLEAPPQDGPVYPWEKQRRNSTSRPLAFAK